ncbi:MAG: PEP-CTERM sorting domain-containing protein [Planctomycetes bacterium]|nr:PEP-CTERM sorting domain-containing protein [Planctomycetota bacterium]
MTIGRVLAGAVCLVAAALVPVLVAHAQPLMRAEDMGLVVEPRRISDGLWFLASGPSPSNLHVVAPANVNAADTTNTDQIWGGTPANLTGAGLTVGVWDGGAVRATHQEFGGRVTVVDAVSLSDHSTHVAGTIGAAGVSPAARGMASLVNIRSRDWANDTVEMAADAGLLVASNHSYSFIRGWVVLIWGGDPVDTWYADRTLYAVEDPYFGKYDSNSQALDQVLYNNPSLLSVWAASNDRGDYRQGFSPPGLSGWYATYLSGGSGGPGWYYVNPSFYPYPPSDGNAGTGYDCLPQGQVAKNSLAIGAISDITVDPYNIGSVAMPSYSSWGPTDDGRVKPDLVANGTSLTSALSGSDAAYGVYSGTSMAAPNVTGTAALLVEYYQKLFGTQPRSATTKALLIHTAFDAGNPGPDYAYGWGIADAAAAALLLGNAAAGGTSPVTIIQEGTYTGTPVVFTIQTDGAAPFKVTLSWTDPTPGSLPGAGLDDGTIVLVSDLDLWVTGPGGTYYPWTLDRLNPANPAVRMTGNHVDNVEQVLIDDPAVGWYSIYIGHTGLGFEQDYSLIVTYSVPEPTTLWLLALAGLGLVRRVARRKK